MKRILVLLGLSLFAFGAAAADAQWLTSLPQAEAQARKEHKLVLMDFTGSDWCPACMELHKAVLTQPEFADYAAKNLVLVMVDFPAKKHLSKALQESNENLRATFNINGFPSLVLVDPNGKKVWDQVGYGGESPSELVSKLAAARAKS